MRKKKNTDFEVIYYDDEQIIIEEDKKRKYPFMIFFFKYGRLITMLLATVSILTFIGGVALTLSSIPRITTPEIANPGTIVEFNKTDNNIDTGLSTPITSEYAEKLFDNNKKSINNSYMKVTNIIKVGNDKVIYFDNGSAVIIYADKNKLPIYVPNANNVYINSKKKTINVIGKTVKTIKKTVLPDGMIVYEFENDKLMTELNDDYKLYNKNKGNSIDIIKVGNDKIIYFDNGTAIVIYNDNKMPDYVDNMENVKINNNVITIDGDKITAKEKRTLPNGTTLYDFSNNKTLSEDKDKENYKLYDTDKIIYDKNGNIYEDPTENNNSVIIGEPNDIVNVNGDLVLYFDNGSAVIIYNDKSKLPEYIPNKNDVNTKTKPLTIEGEKVNTITKKTLPDGTIIYEFANDKALIEKDGTYELVDKLSIKYDEDGNLKQDKQEDINIKEFSIKNNTDEKLKYRIVIEETSDYTLYDNKRLSPEYIRQIVSINGEKQEIQKLDNKPWPIGSELADNLKITNNTYILYEGTIDELDSNKVKLGLWVDYEDATNETQDNWFVGTIKIYSWYENK